MRTHASIVWRHAAIGEFGELLSQELTGSNPAVRVIIFLRFSFNFFLQVFCKSGLGLLLALRFVLRLR